jgi:vancomycin resistance protein VanW
MKRLIPLSLRLKLKLILRCWTDVRSAQFHRIVRSAPKSIQSLAELQGPYFEPRVEIVQALKVASYSENKRQNLTIAATCINNVVIQPDEIFSFWALVGAPIAKRGYLEGRALVSGELKAVMGGGLCQLSGILYYLTLQAGLNAIERYPHSADIYTDETRFTPLGSDATVVYGYKDLRFVNSLSQPMYFCIVITLDKITGQLCTPDPITPYQIELRIQRFPDDQRSSKGYRTEVQTFRSPIMPNAQSNRQQLQPIDISYYR